MAVTAECTGVPVTTAVTGTTAVTDITVACTADPAGAEAGTLAEVSMTAMGIMEVGTATDTTGGCTVATGGSVAGGRRYRNVEERIKPSEFPIT